MEGMHEQLDTHTPNVVSPVSERARRLAGHIKEKYDSEEFQAFWKPAKIAILRGGGTGIRTWIKERLGCEPDFVLKVHTRQRDLGEATPRETWAFVDGRGEKLQGETKGEADDLAIVTFDERAKKYANLERVRSELDRDDWIAEIAKAIWVTSAESPHGYPTSLSAVEHRIVRDNRWWGVRGAPGEDSPRVKDARARVRAAKERAFGGNLKPQEHRDAVEALQKAEENLEEAIRSASTASLSTGGLGGGAIGIAEGSRHRGVWVGLGVGRGPRPAPEWEEKILNQLFLAHYASAENPAGLTPTEREVFGLAIHLEHREIAEKIGSTEGSVRKLKHQAVKKVRKHGEITVRDHIDTNARERGRTRKSA